MDRVDRASQRRGRFADAIFRASRFPPIDITVVIANNNPEGHSRLTDQVAAVVHYRSNPEARRSDGPPRHRDSNS
jgi:hypothetical protein